MHAQLAALQLEGELYFDDTLRILYATDASAYRELPLAVALPKTEADIRKLIRFAHQNDVSLIPRAAGTSLAGQVVGKGIIVDISKYFTEILEVNTDENWVRVQPGVIRDELNHFLKDHDRFFGPETSTANRAMIGGMVGNNSCGSNSVVYGSTRDHLLEVRGFLSDGSEVVFKPLTKAEFLEKCKLDSLEGEIYRNIYQKLQPQEVRQEIFREFPKPEIPRRNTGYALDLLVQNEVFEENTSPQTPLPTERGLTKSPKAGDNSLPTGEGQREGRSGKSPHPNPSPNGEGLKKTPAAGDNSLPTGEEYREELETLGDGSQSRRRVSEEKFNFCKLIAGSEGTLMFLTEIKLNVSPTPPPVKGLLCAHFESVHESLKGNLIALRFNPSACELMDHHVLERTKSNIEHRQNRFFVQDDPQAILVVELSRETEEEVRRDAEALEAALREGGLGYHFPLVLGSDNIKRVWNLRKAGLGLLSNIPGDEKPAPVIEDTAVAVEDLPDYIAEFNEILARYDQYCVHYAHAGSGELHLRPILNLKTAEGQKMFRVIAEEIARLVKKYKGSLSGEHGDGRLRGEFIRQMVGEQNYELMREVKRIFDPKGVFNPNKIVDTPPMDTNLRYEKDQPTRHFETTLNFDDSKGLLRLAEMCNGSGDCRKTELSGGTMCPSYMATRREKDTTRARANVLREILTRSEKKNPFDSEEIKDVMDLCLSCKGCKSECPSNVDVGKLKAEFLSQYHAASGVPFRTKMIGNFTRLNALASQFPALYNFTVENPLIGTAIKKVVGFAPERSLPKLHKTTLRKWLRKRGNTSPQTPLPEERGLKKSPKAGDTSLLTEEGRIKDVYLFVDEFTNYNDTEVGIKTVELLEKLGYRVRTVPHPESGRTFLSKGLLKEAQAVAVENFEIFRDKITAETPLIGVEPSAILSFRDEYPDLLPKNLREEAQALAENVFLLDEFIANERDKGHITSEAFTDERRVFKLHGHCHQKSLSSLTFTKKMLTLPKNYEIHLIRSGCCGMAGSFGYEKEHFEVSQQIGELVLFPTVRKQPEEVGIVAPGTSCRHQIKDGTGRIAQHPAEVLWEALR